MSAQASTNGEPFIRLQGVRKVFRARKQEFLAVSDATFDVDEGELVSLVGPSGCGKTTLLKIVAGLYDHDGGAQTHFAPLPDERLAVRSLRGHSHRSAPSCAAGHHPGDRSHRWRCRSR